MRRIERAQGGPRGLNALGSLGDVVLDNGITTAVIEAIDHPHYIAPAGGNLLDLASAGDDNDSLGHVFGAVGLLPRDSVAYERLEIVEGGGVAAVEVFGHLAGFRDVSVATRYEMRPCEPGLRVRTEVVNRSSEPRVWALVDGWYWSGRSALPFTPARGRGFVQPPISFTAPEWAQFPLVAAASHSDPAASYLIVACDQPSLFGFHTEHLSAIGHAPRIAPPRHVEVYERFIGVREGRAVGPAIDVGLEVRRQLFDEPYVTLRGRVRVPEGDVVGDEVRAAVLIHEGDTGTPTEERIPRTQVVPDAEGRFAARVPARRHFVVELRGFGRTEREIDVSVADEDVDVGELRLEPAAEVRASVHVDGVSDWARVFVRPADPATQESVRARLLDGFVECAPLLGSPTGGSPACARLLISEPVSVLLPPGSYDFFASAGLFTSVARHTVELAAGERRELVFELERLPVAPRGSLSADFHVHGAASFDSTTPDLDRVASFLAANVDVVAATDHDVVWDYADARAALGADERVVVIAGVETTGHIPFDLVPERALPSVIGHWNAFPLPFTPQGPYNGAPWDELAEPGQLFERLVENGWPEAHGVIQLNHPLSGPQVGRDFGFPRAVGVDATQPLPREYDGTGSGLVLRTPPGSRFSNADYHVQEVMNGTSNRSFQPFRAYWFFLLNQGILRAGTANSDSHSLVDNLLGTPRTVVYTDETVESFDVAAFGRAVRDGRMFGTNGPVIEISTTDANGNVRGPSLTPFTPAADALLSVRVRAAPWVPVDEVRVIVNGRVARTLERELTDPASPFGAEGIERLDVTIALAELLPENGRDAWIVVEAGAPLAVNGDLDCDGLPDTGDNDANGTIDWRDVDRNGDKIVDESDLAALDAPPVPCEPQAVGPLGRPPVSARGDRGYTYRIVTPSGYPASFTNPLVLDFGSDGFDPPGVR